MPEPRLAGIRDRLRRTPLYGELGLDLVELGEGAATVALRVEGRHCNLDGALHGGLYALAADTAMGCAARTLQAEHSANKTLEIAVSFYEGAVPGDRVVARARVTRRSGRLTWAEAAVVVEAGEGQRPIGSARTLNYEVTPRAG